MHKVALIVAAIAAAFVGTSASAHVLWQNVEVGMTPDEVRAAQPEARAPARVTTLASGARCELQLRAYEVGGQIFDVCFFMTDGRLSQVTMTAREASFAQLPNEAQR